MANVPYNPVPTIDPTSGGTGASYGDVPQANAAAFGAGIGTAMEGVGDQVNKLADKFANIYNQSTARDATTKTAQQMADAEAQFHKLKGNDAVKGLKPFQDQISQIVKDNSNGLSLNANSMYQADSASLVNNATFRAGAHVGEQAETAQKDSLNASIATNINQFAMNATNPTGATYLGKIQDDALSYAHHMGVTDPAVADQLVSKNYSDAFASAIKINLQSSPDAAQKLWDQASTGVITKPDGTTVPYLDAEHRASIASEMQSEFKRQAQNTLWDASSLASAGDPYNKDAVNISMTRAGYTKDDIAAHINHLDNVQSNFGGEQDRYDLNKTYQNDAALAYAGKAPVGTYDPDAVKQAFHKDPDKAQDFLNEVNQLHQIAGFVGGMPTRTPVQNQEELDKFAPHANSPIDFVLNHEGGYVSNDSGKGPTNFGINQESNPGVDVKNLTQDQARNIIKTKYADAIGADNMSPALAAVAVDSAVNMGVGKTQTFLAQAGGDAQKLLDLRRVEYQRLANNDPDKYGKYLPAWNSRLDDLQKSLPTLGQAQNFGSQSDLHDKMQKAAQDYYKQLNDDPAGTINSNDSRLNSMFSDAVQDNKNPQKMVDYVNQVAARQGALQVPEASRSVLPKAYAASITNSLITNPESAPTQLAKMATDYGNNWPAVYKSLVQQGGMPPAYQIVQQLGADPTTDKYGTMFARYLGSDETKGKTDEVLMGGAAPLKELNEAVAGNSDIKSLTLSLARSGASPSQVAGTVGSAQKLAMAIHFYDPSDSNPAETAIKAMTSKYAYLPDGGARVPIDKLDSISSNAQVKLNNIENIMSPAQFVPNTYANRQQYIDDVKSSPSWVTRGADNKIYLYDHFGRAVEGLDGKQVSVGFDDPMIRSPIANPPELTQQPNQNLGRGEIPAKGSIADALPGFASSVGDRISSGVRDLSEKAKEKESQTPGLLGKHSENKGAGEIARNGSIIDILGGD